MNRAMVVMACLAMLAGCDDGRGGDDAGGIVLMDSGPGSDAGPPATVDAGPGGCAPMQSSAPQMPMACAASTLTCLMGAGTAMAQQACIMADANAANCGACIQQDVFFTCTSPSGGCAQQWGDIQCCAMMACPTADQACIQGALAAGGACATQAMAFDTCTASAQMAMRCGVTQTCFMAAMPFQPSFEPTELMSVQLDRAALVSAIAASITAR